MKKSLLFLMLVGLSSMVLAVDNIKQPVVYVKHNQANNSVKPLKSNSGREKLANCVFSDAKVEYADVVTIERLKKAVVILINKVENFEKRLKVREVGKKDLSNFEKKVLSRCNNNNTEKAIAELRRYVSENSRKIADLNDLNNVKLSKKTSTNISIPSKYDKKIMDFLKKEKE